MESLLCTPAALLLSQISQSQNQFCLTGDALQVNLLYRPQGVRRRRGGGDGQGGRLLCRECRAGGGGLEQGAGGGLGLPEERARSPPPQEGGRGSIQAEKGALPGEPVPEEYLHWLPLSRGGGAGVPGRRFQLDSGGHFLRGQIRVRPLQEAFCAQCIKKPSQQQILLSRARKAPHLTLRPWPCSWGEGDRQCFLPPPWEQHKQPAGRLGGGPPGASEKPKGSPVPVVCCGEGRGGGDPPAEGQKEPWALQANWPLPPDRPPGGYKSCPFCRGTAASAGQISQALL